MGRKWRCNLSILSSESKSAQDIEEEGEQTIYKSINTFLELSKVNLPKE